MSPPRGLGAGDRAEGQEPVQFQSVHPAGEPGGRRQTREAVRASGPAGGAALDGWRGPQAGARWPRGARSAGLRPREGARLLLLECGVRQRPRQFCGMPWKGSGHVTNKGTGSKDGHLIPVPGVEGGRAPASPQSSRGPGPRGAGLGGGRAWGGQWRPPRRRDRGQRAAGSRQRAGPPARTGARGADQTGFEHRESAIHYADGVV